MKVRDGFQELLEENPIYHLEQSSFSSAYFNDSYFYFDSSSTPENYVITYSCPYSSDNHGAKCTKGNWLGESYETGRLVINKTSFAFCRIERNSFRNRHYNYPYYNNFLLPSRNYYTEFEGGNFIAKYKPMNGKWVLKTLLYSYTNDFFRTRTYNKEFSITENFEWYVDSVSRYVDETLVNKFYKIPALPYQPYSYDSTAWENVPPFFFYPKEEVYKDLERSQPAEQIFRKSGSIEDVP